MQNTGSVVLQEGMGTAIDLLRMISPQLSVAPNREQLLWVSIPRTTFQLSLPSSTSLSRRCPITTEYLQNLPNT